MSYSVRLKERNSNEVIKLPYSHIMTGGTYAAEYDNVTKKFYPRPMQDAWLNIIYNYSHYYYEATEGDKRFAHNEVSAYYADGTQGPVQTEYGIRGIYGKTGAESIPMLEDMIKRIEEKYKKDGKWVTSIRDVTYYYDENGKEIPHDVVFSSILNNKEIKYTTIKQKEEISEGPNPNYWTDTAANAIKPLYQLIAMAQLRPDGVWNGD